jgi:hypothetical protein
VPASVGAEEDKENAELSARWTLRKQAALLLDTVAQSFPAGEVLPPALARIQACFQDGSALVRESGVLALGALSTGEEYCVALVTLLFSASSTVR